MTHRIFIFLIVLWFGTASAQEYTLEVQIANNPSEEFYLANFYGDKNALIDTAQVDSTGTARFILEHSAPSGMYRVYLNPQVFFDLIINKENIKISSDFNDIYESLVVHESAENQLFYEYLLERHDYSMKFDLLKPVNDYYPTTDSFFHVARAQYIGIQAEFQVFINDVVELYPDFWATRVIKTQRPLFYDPSMDETARRQYTIDHFFDNFDFNDVELIKSNVYTSAAIQYMSLYSNSNLSQDQLEAEFIKAVDKIMYEALDNSLIYEFIVEYLVGGFQQYQFEKVLDYIAENYTPEQCENEDRKSDLQTRLEKYAELTVGKEAPEIQIPNVEGNTIKLSKIKSDYTLVVFWASWCPHCKELLPQIKNIFESSLNARKLQVLSISIDTERTEWETALSEEAYPWINASELNGWDSQAAIDYNIYATPSMFLLDKDKKIVAKPITFNALKQALMDENLLQ